MTVEDIKQFLITNDVALQIMGGLSVNAITALANKLKLYLNSNNSGLTTNAELVDKIKSDLPEVNVLSRGDLLKIIELVASNFKVGAKIHVENVTGDVIAISDSPEAFVIGKLVNSFDVNLTQDVKRQLLTLRKDSKIQFRLASQNPKSFSLMEATRKFLTENGYTVNNGHYMGFYNPPLTGVIVEDSGDSYHFVFGEY